MMSEYLVAVVLTSSYVGVDGKYIHQLLLTQTSTTKIPREMTMKNPFVHDINISVMGATSETSSMI